MPAIGKSVSALGSAFVLSLACAGVQAQSPVAFPSRAVSIVVPFAPGGGADLLGRLMADRLAALWKQPVVVENRPGDAGMIGVNGVARAAPDGHTLVLAANGAVAGSNRKDVAPVSLVSTPANFIAVGAGSPVKSLTELVALAKAKPGEVSYASSGAGSATHLAGETFMERTATKLTHVPYKGMGQAVQDLIGGNVTMMFGPVPVIQPHLKSGRVRALAIATKERSSQFPDLPTATEAGVPGFESVVWFGLLAPANTPPEIVRRIAADSATVLKLPDVAKVMVDGGYAPVGSTPEAFATFLDEDISATARLMSKIGLTPR